MRRLKQLSEVKHAKFLSAKLSRALFQGIGLLRKDLLGREPSGNVHEMIDGNHPRSRLTRDKGTELRNEGHGEQRSSPYS